MEDISLTSIRKMNLEIDQNNSTKRLVLWIQIIQRIFVRYQNPRSEILKYQKAQIIVKDENLKKGKYDLKNIGETGKAMEVGR
mgnify:CR=1 FL=1